MLALAFFISVFSTLTWLIFAVAYINDHLNGVAFSSLGITDISVYVGLALLPILILWMVFGFINQYLGNRTLSNNMFSLFRQMKKNQDYTDLIARIMLEAEQEIKDGFILNKFDLFVADMNELIADLLTRCNIASTDQTTWNYRILDLQGITMTNGRTNSSETTITLDQLKSGIYILELTQGNEKRVLKFVR